MMTAVPMSDRDRKILWGRAANRCATCRRVLIAGRTDEDPEAVVGDEAHIAAHSPGGPRYGDCEPSIVDTYDNRILLCKVHHKLVDDQPGEYTTKRLLRIKADHEAWVEQTLGEIAQPVQLRPHPDEGPVLLRRLQDGSDVWDVVSASQAYRFAGLADDNGTDDELDLTAEFLQQATDWGEISGDVAASGPVAIRDAKRSLAAALTGLTERGLVVYGGRRRLLLTGGVGPPTIWHEAVLQIFRADDPRIAAQSRPHSRRSPRDTE
jgi:hypothetical protein